MKQIKAFCGGLSTFVSQLRAKTLVLILFFPLFAETYEAHAAFSSANSALNRPLITDWVACAFDSPVNPQDLNVLLAGVAQAGGTIEDLGVDCLLIKGLSADEGILSHLFDTLRNAYAFSLNATMTGQYFISYDSLVDPGQEAIRQTNIWNSSYRFTSAFDILNPFNPPRPRAPIAIGTIDSTPDPQYYLTSEVSPALDLTPVFRNPSYNSHAFYVGQAFAPPPNNLVGRAGTCPIPICSWVHSGINYDGTRNLSLLSEALRAIGAIAALPIHQLPQIVNMSFGAPIGFLPLRTALSRLSERGVLLVASAGNERLYPEEESHPTLFPAAFDNVLAVAASTQGWGGGWTSAHYSNRGTLSAPGTIFVQGDPERGSHRWQSRAVTGTSFAAPQVSGAAGMIYYAASTKPEFSRLSPQDQRDFVVNLLKTTATPIGDPLTTGYGNINMAASLQQVEEIGQNEWDTNLKMGAQEDISHPSISPPPLPFTDSRLESVAAILKSKPATTRYTSSLHESLGSCWISGSVSVSLSDLQSSVNVEDLSLTPSSGGRAFASVRYKQNLESRLVVKVVTVPGLACLNLGDLGYTVIRIGLSWDGNSTTLTKELKLRANRYTAFAEPRFNFGQKQLTPSTSINGLPLPSGPINLILRFVAEVRNSLYELDRVVDGQMVAILGDLFEKPTLNQFETRFARFLKKIESEQPALFGEAYSLRTAGSHSNTTTALAEVGVHNSQIGTYAMGVTPEGPSAPTSPIQFEPLDRSRVVEHTPVQILEYELEKIKAMGLFHTDHNPYWNVDVKTITSPNLREYRFTSVLRIPSRPRVEAINGQNTWLLLKTLAFLDLTVRNEDGSQFIAQQVIPLYLNHAASAHDTERELGQERNYGAISRLTFEQQIRIEPVRGQSVDLFGYSDELSSILSRAELEAFINLVYREPFARIYGALTSGMAFRGDTKGHENVGVLPDVGNHVSIFSATKQEGWDLSKFFYLRPPASIPARVSNQPDISVRSFNFEPRIRYDAPEPFAEFSPVQVGHTLHPRATGVVRMSYLSFDFTPNMRRGANSIQYYLPALEGIAILGRGGSRHVVGIQHLAQVAQLPNDDDTIVVWTPRGGLGNARPAFLGVAALGVGEDLQIQDSCIPLEKWTFPPLPSTLDAPPIYEKEFRKQYRETPLTLPVDNMVFQNHWECDDGIEPQPRPTSILSPVEPRPLPSNSVGIPD